MAQRLVSITMGIFPEIFLLQRFQGQWFSRNAFPPTYYVSKEFQNSLIVRRGCAFYEQRVSCELNTELPSQFTMSSPLPTSLHLKNIHSFPTFGSICLSFCAINENRKHQGLQQNQFGTLCLITTMFYADRPHKIFLIQFFAFFLLSNYKIHSEIYFVT